MSKMKMKREELLMSIWALKYRPKTLDDVILPERLKKKVRKWIDTKQIPHMLLVSPNPGTGKTTIAKIIIEALDADVLMINGSQNGNIDTLRTKITSFAKNVSIFGKQKIVFIDEADGLTPQTQEAMRMFLEEHADSVRFILTGNYYGNFIEPLCSRLRVLEFELQKDEQGQMMQAFSKRVQDVLEAENIKYSSEVIAKVVFNHFPDYRDCWEVFEDIYDTFGEITQVNVTSRGSIDRLVESINTKNLMKVRETLQELSDINFTTIYGYLFKRIDNVDFEINNVAMNLAIYQEKSSRAADKLLNFVGCVADIYLSEE